MEAEDQATIDLVKVAAQFESDWSKTSNPEHIATYLLFLAQVTAAVCCTMTTHKGRIHAAEIFADHLCDHIERRSKQLGCACAKCAQGATKQ